MEKKLKSVWKYNIIVACALFIVMVASAFSALSLSQKVASAAEVPVEVTTFGELKAEVGRVNGSGTIKLMADMEMRDSAVIIGANKTITVDLNGFTLKYVSGSSSIFDVANKAHLIIDDSSSDKEGKLVDTSTSQTDRGIISVKRDVEGNITIKNGIIDASRGSEGIENYGGGTITIEGGKIIARSFAIYAYSDKCKIVMTGGLIEDIAGAGTDMILSRGTFEMKGGEIKSQFIPEYGANERLPYYVVNNWGQMTMSGGSITSKNCVTIFNNATTADISLTMTDGLLQSGNTSTIYAKSPTAAGLKESLITISGGKVTSAANLAANKATIRVGSALSKTPNIKILGGEVSNTNSKEGFSVAFPSNAKLSECYSHSGGKVGKVYPGTAVVTYDANGGTPVDGAEVLFLNKLTAVISTKSGATLEGWYTDVDFEEKDKWNFETDLVSSSMILYAKWTTNKYNVTFNSNGGSTVAKLTGVEHGNSIAKPTDPTNDNYSRFGGWYKDADFATPWNFESDKVEADITLYAKWSNKTLLYVRNYKFEGITTVYTGSPVTIVATGFDQFITVSYTSNSLTDVGTIEARATFVINPLSAEHYEFADGIDYLTANITITKAPVAFTWSQDNKTASPSVSGATVTYTYSSSESGEYTSTVPTAPGTYWVKATVTGTNNYNAFEEIKSFTIAAVTSANLTWLWVMLCIILLLIIAYVATFFFLYKRGVLKGDVWAKIYLPLNAIFKDKK